MVRNTITAAEVDELQVLELSGDPKEILDSLEERLR
jgi:hypothetical protein